MIDVARLEPRDLLTWWPRIARDVETVCAHSSGRFAPEHVVQAVAAGHFILWVGHREGEALAILLARILRYPTGLKTLELLACTGRERVAWQTRMPEIEAFARSIGCQMMEALSRPGWGRVLGWRQTHVLLEHDL